MSLFGDGPPPMAMCPACDEPLVSTLEFKYKEFICMGCGRKWEFLSPRAAVATPELEARQAELAEQYRVEREARQREKQEAEQRLTREAGAGT